MSGGWSVWVKDEDQNSWLRVADNLRSPEANSVASQLNAVSAKVVKTDSTGREVAQVLYSEFEPGDRVCLKDNRSAVGTVMHTITLTGDVRVRYDDSDVTRPVHPEYLEKIK